MNEVQSRSLEQLSKVMEIEHITQEPVVMKESKAHYRLSGWRCGEITRSAISGTAKVIN